MTPPETRQTDTPTPPSETKPPIADPPKHRYSATIRLIHARLADKPPAKPKRWWPWW